jgi:hypothetical protein
MRLLKKFTAEDTELHGVFRYKSFFLRVTPLPSAKLRVFSSTQSVWFSFFSLAFSTSWLFFRRHPIRPLWVSFRPLYAMELLQIKRKEGKKNGQMLIME